jgi:uncharacterized metal-binding protein YceD (DUF177 family)
MDPLIEFTIPIRGLGDGIHQFEYQIEDSFFSHFEASPVPGGKIHMAVSLEKKPNLYTLYFDFSGTVRTSCDRCLAAIDLPIEGRERMLVKVSNETESPDPEVVFLSPEADRLELAPLVYEFIILAIPLIKVFDCESTELPPCNQEMLDRLEQPEQEEAPEENPIWEELRKFNKNN